MATDYWCLINYCDCYSLSKSLVEVMPIHVILRSWYDTANNVSLECHCWKKSRILQNKIILWTGLQPTASKLSPPVHRLAVPLLSSHQLAGLCQTSANFLMSKCYCSALVFWAAYQAISWSHENMIFFMTLYPFTFLSISRDTLYLSPGRKGFSCTKPYLCRSNIGFRFWNISWHGTGHTWYLEAVNEMLGCHP